MGTLFLDDTHATTTQNKIAKRNASAQHHKELSQKYNTVRVCNNDVGNMTASGSAQDMELLLPVTVRSVKMGSGHHDAVRRSWIRYHLQ